MVGFEPRSSEDGIDHSVNFARTASKHTTVIFRAGSHGQVLWDETCGFESQHRILDYIFSY